MNEQILQPIAVSKQHLKCATLSVEVCYSERQPQLSHLSPLSLYLTDFSTWTQIITSYKTPNWQKSPWNCLYLFTCTVCDDDDDDDANTLGIFKYQTTRVHTCLSLLYKPQFIVHTEYCVYYVLYVKAISKCVICLWYSNWATYLVLIQHCRNTAQKVNKLVKYVRMVRKNYLM